MKVFKCVIQKVGFCLSFPLRLCLLLYPPKTNTILYKRNNSKIYYIRRAYADILRKNVDIPMSVEIGDNLNLVHNGYGVVIHPYTKIGNNVRIYPQVTIGRGDIWQENSMDGFDIGDSVVLCTGAKILCSKGKLTIGRGSVIGANSILTCSTGENEIWAGVPARFIRKIK